MTPWIIALSCLATVLAAVLLVVLLWARSRLCASGRLAVPDVVGQDPTSEPQWFFRRVFTWGVTIVVLCLIGAIIAIMPPGDLKMIALALIALVALLSTFYIIAPSAPEIAAIVAAARRSPPPSGDAS